MAADWSNPTLGNLLDQGDAIILTGPFGTQLHAHDYEPVGLPVIPTQAIQRRTINVDTLPRISDATANRLSRYTVRTGDILFARRGAQATGLSALVRPEHDGWICGTGVIVLRLLSKRIDPEFLSLFLSSDTAIEWLKTHAVGAVMPNLNEGVLRGLPLLLPPLPEQHAIAHILGTLDDKIALNRRMNATLEEMARALFRSWFVDFDPVRAKAEGRQPVGMDAATAALFPDAFEETRLGLVPSGWRVSTIGEAVKVVGGGTPSTKEPSFWEGGEYWWATPKDLAGIVSPILLSTERKITAAGLQQISSGLLPAGTVLLSSRAPVGYLALAQVPVAINQGFIAMLCDKEVPNYYMLQWASEHMDTIKSHANGTTFLEVSKANLRPIPLVVPPEPLTRAFAQRVQPLYQRIATNLRESTALAGVRDFLLPKLLSGAIRVREAEQQHCTFQE